jgi:hypothetical protein
VVEQTAVEVVRAFAADLRSVHRRLAAPCTCVQSVRDLVFLAQRGEIPRDGELDDGTRYSVLGAGCRFVGSEGHEVDVDIDGGGVEFDVWRVRVYAGSVLGGGSVPHDEISAACRTLAASGELVESRRGWFRLPGDTDAR